jgi:hypothetical protein
VKEDLISYIVSRVPRELFLRLPGELEAAYNQAHSDSIQKCGEPEQIRVRGQLRHYYQNGKMRELANTLAIPVLTPHTDPKGERFPLIYINEVVMGRTAVAFTNKLPPLARHRKAIAAVNSRLEPINSDMFTGDGNLPQQKDGLGILITTVHAPKNGPQNIPSHFVVGVPYSNLKGWHMFEPLGVILGAYDAVAPEKPQDIAFPILKKQLIEAENGS